MESFLGAQVYNPIEGKYRNRQICKPDNVHQKKINQPVGFQRNPIFLPNRRYLLMKVMLIIETSGACRGEELTFLDVKNIPDKGSY
ncbi:hypothetical protein MTP99_003067 [Tenebrio molitor]|nr:hypothetical protein MTP99_003067 [Tenebrio molitor]